MVFKKGDRVICINATGQESYLRHEGIYTVNSVPCNRFIHLDKSGGFYSNRFELAYVTQEDIIKDYCID